MDLTDLAYAGAAEQARLIAAQAVTAREVVQATLDRIAAVDPSLNAYRVVLAEPALAAADAADALVAGGGALPPMLGVPVAIKDDTDVAGEITALGSGAHVDVQAVDSDVVTRLREAGAIVVGKTNVPELTVWPFTETLAYGATRNPWNTDYTPGGSSGGSGAAAAAGLCGVAQGSDGMGSIRIPAAFNGLFGLKTQRGAVSLGPHHLDAWHGLTVYGPLARRVEDAALFLDATAAKPRGSSFVAAARTPPRPLRIAVSTGLPKGALARVGVDAQGAVQDVAGALRELGHTVTEQEIDYPLAAFRQALIRYLRGIHDEAARTARPEALERRTRGMARLGGLIPAGQLVKARAGEAAVAARINAIFDDHDAVLTPGPTGPPFRIGALHGRGALWTVNAAGAKVPFYPVFNLTGQPAASIPAGFDAAGLPLSVQLVGRPDGEATLIALGAPARGAVPVGRPTSPDRVSDPRTLLAVAQEAARAGGELLAERFATGRVVALENKSSPTDQVSQTDLDAERIIRERLTQRRPADALMGEEGDDQPGTSGLRWIIDPLDGTTDFLYGIPQWAVSVAVEDAAGDALAGVVFDPLRDELWAATVDGPPTLNGIALERRPPPPFETALLATGFSYSAPVRAQQAQVLAAVLPQVRDIRRFGSAALDLAWTAAGRCDAYWERGTQRWDVAAGMLICERAGLVVEPLAPSAEMPAGVLAAPVELVGALRELVA